MEDLEKDFRFFIEGLMEAGRNMEDSHYFQLPVFKKEDPIFRERVYCYELYHQIRNFLGEKFPYKLDGEVDKRGHPTIPGKIKPDFIVHFPGDMDRNLVVIEVKPITVNNADLEDDLKKLLFLLEKGNYYRAIMLLYGNGRSNLSEKVYSKINNYSMKCQNRILLAWHHGWNEKIEIIQFS